MQTIHKKLLEHIDGAQKTWGLGYGHFSKILNNFNLKTGIEIGVAFGGHAEAILKNTNVEKLYGVDPYEHTIGYNDPMNYPQIEFDELYKLTLKRLSKFGNRYKHIRKYSCEAVDLVPDESDFVYIDADHSYFGVWNDLCTWFPKIRTGGIIGGHDYMHTNFPGVKKAIDEFFRRFGWEVHHEGDGVWWVEKKSLNISFFIPTYNYGRSIRASVESVVRDNFSPGDELIIVDDCSTDDTAKNLLELKSEYPEIQIITHKINKGPSASRNDAVEMCNNPIIFSLDHDNILVPGTVKKLKTFLLNSGLDVATFGELHYFSENIKNVSKKWIFKEGLFTLQDALNGSYFPGASGNYMFTKESWLRAGKYPDSWLDSWGFGIRQLATGSKMQALPKTSYFHQFRNTHGYESTYVKGVRTGRISSLVALQILIPFLHLLERSSANYIMSEKGRNTWFDKLSKKPIKVRFNDNVEYDDHIQKKVSIKSYIAKIILKAKYTARKIKNYLN